MPHFFSKCGALFPLGRIIPSDSFFQVWRTFHSVRIFSSVVYFFKCAAFFQVCCIFLSVAQFSKCGVYFQVFRIFQVWHSFQVWRTFPIVAQAPKAAPFFKCMAYSSCVEPNSKCGPVTKCCAILQVWCSFPSVAHFTKFARFLSVAHFSKLCPGYAWRGMLRFLFDQKRIFILNNAPFVLESKFLGFVWFWCNTAQKILSLYYLFFSFVTRCGHL